MIKKSTIFQVVDDVIFDVLDEDILSEDQHYEICSEVADRLQQESDDVEDDMDDEEPVPQAKA